MLDGQGPGDDLPDGLVGQDLAEEHVAGLGGRRRSEVAAEGAYRLGGEAEVAGGVEGAQRGGVHDAGLEEHGGQPAVALVLVEGPDAAGLGDGIDQQFAGQPLRLLARQAALDQIAVGRARDRLVAPTRRRAGPPAGRTGYPSGCG